MDKDLFHVVTPSPIAGWIVIGGKLHRVPADTLQVISLRATGAAHANGARFGEVVYQRKIAPGEPIYQRRISKEGARYGQA